MNTLAADVVAPTTTDSGHWRVIRTIAVKEWLDIYRDSRLRWLAALTALLMLCALLFGANQMQRSERDQAAAAQADRQLWISQGAKDPHAAAHFGQYAFKPQSPLALADLGIDAYAGTAVWLEAHKQNEVQFRPARDSGLSARLGNLSLAFVLQTVMPLLAVMLGFAAFSGERERGTLRQLLSLGVRPVDLLLGKGLAIAALLTVLLLPTFASIVMGMWLFTDTALLSLVDQWVRLAWLSLGYLFYIGGFVLLALAASAFAATSRTALALLLGFWLINCFLMPRLMTDWVRDSQPLPTALEFNAAVAEERKRDFGHDESHPAFVAFRDEVLLQYGVTNVEALPVNFRGLSLRKSDEVGYAIYDSHFGALQQAYARQDRWRAAPGFILPWLAIQPFSMALAGTDSRSHHHFTIAAEQHRRTIQTMISDDVIHNNRHADPSYSAPPALWAEIPAFTYLPPSSAWALPAQLVNLSALAFWCGVAALLALCAVQRLKPV